MKVSMACDHGAYDLKETLKAYLTGKGYEIVDEGCYSKESCDYPDFAHKLADGIESGECSRGIGICGSGEGISMTLNKHQGIRAALVWQPEIAHMARLHNDANVLVLPGRYINEETAESCLDEFFNTSFEGGRHLRRIEKIKMC